jgi:hypothetical protein
MSINPSQNNVLSSRTAKVSSFQSDSKRVVYQNQMKDSQASVNRYPMNNSGHYDSKNDKLTQSHKREKVRIKDKLLNSSILTNQK